jgi:long-chain acyl-CoA synthetase
MNLARILEDRARSNPHSVGLIFEDGQAWTFEELNLLAGRAATWLSRLGFGEGDRVGMYLRNSPKAVAVMFGIWRIGATVVSINDGYGEDDFAHAVAITSPSLVLSGPDSELSFADLTRHGIRAEQVNGAAELDVYLRSHDYDDEIAQCVDLDANAESTIIFTGGSTGKQKAVARTHAGDYASLVTSVEIAIGRPGPFPMAPAGTPPNLVCFPLAHASGRTAVLFAFVAGRSVLLMSRFRVEPFARLVAQYRVRSLSLMPTMMHDLVEARSQIDLSSVRTVVATGQALQAELRARFESRFGALILTSYGSTEAGGIASWEASDLRDGSWIPGSAGRLMPGVVLEIRDENGKALEPGQTGEICVRGGVASRYLGEAPNARDGLLQDGWVHTGDVGCVTEDRVLFVTGRVREMIKCGGFQVWPRELEELLLRHPLVRDVAVVGRPDTRLGEIPVAYVVTGSTSANFAEELIEYCRANVAHYKCVRDVILVDHLPRTSVGKLARSELESDRG